jgi:hypothetical protein
MARRAEHGSQLYETNAPRVEVTVESGVFDITVGPPGMTASGVRQRAEKTACARALPSASKSSAAPYTSMNMTHPPR